MTTSLLSFLFILNISTSSYQLADCKILYDQFKQQQNKLRQGYSAKQEQRLKRKERKARDLWWRCTKRKLTAKEIKALLKVKSTK